MTERTRLRTQAGFTLLEVLVGALVFMIGFSIAIGILNGTLAKLHVDELTQAGAVGQMVMEQTVANQDTIMLDTIIVRNGRQLHLTRSVRIDDGFAAVDLAVNRPGSGRVLLKWYCEYALSAK